MENVITYIKESILKEVYPDRATVSEKIASNDIDININDASLEWWNTIGKETIWRVYFRFFENIIFKNNSLVNIIFGDTILPNKAIKYSEGVYFIEFPPIPDPDNEGEILNQYALIKEVMTTKLPIYFEAADVTIRRYIVPQGVAKFRAQDIDFSTFDLNDEVTTLSIPRLEVVYSRKSPYTDHLTHQNDVINVLIGARSNSDFMKFNPTIVLLRKKNIKAVMHSDRNKLKKSKLKWVDCKNGQNEYNVNIRGGYFIPNRRFDNSPMTLQKLIHFYLREVRTDMLNGAGGVLTEIKLSANRTKTLPVVDGNIYASNELKGVYALCIRIDNPLFNSQNSDAAEKAYTWNWQPKYLYGPKTRMILGIKQVSSPITSLAENFIHTIEIID